MMSLISLVLVILVACLVSVGGLEATTSTLKHANLIYRHGARSPYDIYPSDINQLDTWPDGLKFLTNLGKQQQYELGQYLRQRYQGFVNTTRYDHRQILVQSSAAARCLMSAQANLAGMFPPQGEQLWKKDLLWQPIPVLTMPRDVDNKVSVTAKCPRYDQLFNDLYKLPQAREYQRKNQKFFDMLSNKTGWEEPSTYLNTWKIIDPLDSELAHNLTLTPWLREDGVLDKLKEIQHTSWSLLYGTTEMARLKGGPLLQEIIQNMETAAASTGSPDDVKLHIYSGHDSTVSALLNAMRVSDKRQPPYNALVMVELHSLGGQDVVRIFYRNDTRHPPRQLNPPGCEDPCLLPTFHKLMEDTMPQDWEEECRIPPNSAQPSGPLKAIPVSPLSLLVTLTAMMTSSMTGRAVL